MSKNAIYFCLSIDYNDIKEGGADMEKGGKTLPREVVVTLLLLGLTAIGITVTGILYEQSFWRMLPLYISLFVMLLNTRVNRYGLLVGSLNSLLYAAVYFYYGYYGQMTSAVALSFTTQMVTFILWTRKPYGSSTVFRRLTGRWRVLTALLALLLTAGGVVILRRVGASSSLLDGAITSIGIVVMALQMLSYIEYVFVNVLNTLLQLVLYASILPTQPEQSTFLVYTVYCLICVVLAAIRIGKLYLEQKEKGVAK